MQALPAALAPLAACEQFVTWYAWPRAGHPGKFDKIPTHWSTGAPCNAQDPANWTSAAAALAMAPTQDRGHGSGAGFVFTANDPFFFLDIDGALTEAGTWSPLAVSLCERFTGAAVEVSHSGRGLHVFGRTAPLEHGTRNTPHHLELYTSGRFVALTGTYAAGDASQDCTAAFAATVSQYFPPAATSAAVTAGEWTTEPCAEWRGPADDGELVRRMLAASARSAAAAFGGRLTLAQLWRGEIPDDYRSEADQLLANHLAWWTGKDCERIERLMRASALLRDKWDSPSHADYLTTTILKACAYVTSVYVERAAAPAPSAPPAPAAEVQGVAAPTSAPARQRDAGREFMGAYEQLDHFAGCTFISDLKSVYSARRNKLFEREAFDVEYGGHLFVIDPAGSKTTDSAWLALTRSRVNVPPIVDDLCFRPHLAAGEVVHAGGWSMVNTYAPYAPRTLAGNAEPWLRHVRAMLPEPGDADVLLLYMAHLAQRPGVKIPWWPVVQGVKGNGKTMLLEVMEYINGERYSHRPNSAALAKDGMKFNAWLQRKTFLGFDEVSLAHKRDFLEELKAVVTGSRIQIEGKGVNAGMGDNAANGMIMTNHPDGVPVDDDERRYAVLYCAQQHKSDLARDGLTEAYFNDLRAWLADGGNAIVAHYLLTYPLPAAMPSRAPATTSRDAAVRMSLGRAEQEIVEAIEEGRPGFMGGWVSSKYLDALLDGIRAAVPRNKRRAMMQTLGYDYHPALPDGRAPDLVTPDNSRSRLYVRAGHLSLNVESPAAVMRLYATAQGASAALTGRSS